MIFFAFSKQFFFLGWHPLTRTKKWIVDVIFHYIFINLKPIVWWLAIDIEFQRILFLLYFVFFFFGMSSSSASLLSFFSREKLSCRVCCCCCFEYVCIFEYVQFIRSTVKVGLNGPICSIIIIIFIHKRRVFQPNFFSLIFRICFSLVDLGCKLVRKKGER